jgi:alkylation response protein AidB-like acyl-CoA dehydrogenase
MDFELSEEHRMLQGMVREFVAAELEPVASQLDEEKRFPTEILEKMAKLGLLGIPYPEEHEGAGMDTLAFALAIEEISGACGSTGLTLAAHSSLCTYPIYAFGTEEQKKKYLPDLCSGRAVGAFSLTEPDAGSDAAGLKTTAVRKNGGYALNGTKMYVTNGGYSKTIVAFARTDSNVPKHKGLTSFIVESDFPGYKLGKEEKKLGLNASNTQEVIYEDCMVPEENMLGQLGDGFKIAMKVLDGGRVGIAAMALGIAQSAYQRSLQYAKERVQFNKPISSLQAIQFKLADMATEIAAARHMVYHSAWLKDQGKPFEKQAAMAKLFASEVAMRVTNQAIQVHGGYGYIKDYPVERYFRDAKLTTIGEGTSEVHRLVIARYILQEL